MTSVLVHFFLAPGRLVLPAAGTSLRGSSQSLGLSVGYDPTGASGLILHKSRPIETKTGGFCHKELVYKIMGAAQTNPKMVWRARSKRYLGASKFREGLHSLPDKFKRREASILAENPFLVHHPA